MLMIPSTRMISSRLTPETLSGTMRSQKKEKRVKLELVMLKTAAKETGGREQASKESR
jgi:hypothetical protein